MRIPRIYLPLSLAVNQRVELNEHAFQHTIKVLRMKENAELILFDGKGNEYAASLEQVNKKNAFAKINTQINNHSESNLSVHLAIGISKGERMDYAIQKAVELGVTEITPLFTEHCVVNLDEKRKQKRLQHWQGVIISACEQSGRTILPKLNESKTIQKWRESINSDCIVLDPLADKCLKDISKPADNVNLIIGPEGGLSPSEISELVSNNHFHAVKFGPRILRTETAAVSVITALQLLWGDLLG